MPTPPVHHVFPCAGGCGASVHCWPYQASSKRCPACLRLVKVLNGKRTAAKRQPPLIGAKAIRRIRGIEYRIEYQPAHPRRTRDGWMLHHRLVWERTHGRLLTSSEVVHHIDHDGLNNDPENLLLYPSKGAHLAAEHSADGVKARMAGYPICACGKRTAYGSAECWPCWASSQTCPTCKRPDRKMALRKMCHGCYKGHRLRKAPSARQASTSAAQKA